MASPLSRTEVLMTLRLEFRLTMKSGTYPSWAGSSKTCFHRAPWRATTRRAQPNISRLKPSPRRPRPIPTRARSSILLARHLGQVLKEIVAPIGPEVVVLGGGISRSSHLFLPAARNQMNGLGIRLVPSVLLEKSPLLGAAVYWRDCAIPSSPSNSTLATQP